VTWNSIQTQRGEFVRTVIYSLVIALGVAGCSKDTSSPLAAYVTSQASTQKPNGTNRASSESGRLEPGKWPTASMPPGKVSLKCDETAKQPIQLTDNSENSLFEIMLGCADRLKVRTFEITYSGEIGDGFAALIARMNDMIRRFDVQEPELSIDSGGGDVAEALRASNLMAEHDWHVVVPNDANCFSACVLVLAAGSVRAVSGQVGIHRMIPEKSSAKSIDELNDELSGTHDLVSAFFAKNGVSTTVADLMMTVPAGDIRILSQSELKDFGLGWTNAAQSDLSRLKMINQCGTDYVARRDSFIRLSKQCKHERRDEQGFSAYQECITALAYKLKLPDSRCPESPAMILLDRGPGN